MLKYLALLLLTTQAQAALPEFRNEFQKSIVCEWLDGVVDSYRQAILVPNKFLEYEKQTLYIFLLHRKAVCGTGSDQEIQDLGDYLDHKK